MLNFNKEDAHCYPLTESPGAGIIMDIDLEQMIRESERLRVCEAVFQSGLEPWQICAALNPVLNAPSTPVLPQEADDHA